MGGRWPWSALFAVAVWGGSFIATKYALGPPEARVFTPAGLVALRFLLGGGALLVVLAVRGPGLLPEREDRKRVALLGAILGLHIGLQAQGLTFTLATHASWIVCFTAVTIALGAQLFLGQRLPLVGWLGALLAMAGVWGVIQSHTAAPGSRVGFGDFLQFVSCFTWAAYTLLGSRPVRRSGALRVTTWASLTAGGLLLGLTSFSGFGNAPGPTHLAALVYLGLVSSAAAFLAWYHAQQKYGSQRTAATLYLEPFVTAIVASFLDEPLVLATLLGGGVVLCGVYLVQRSALRV